MSGCCDETEIILTSTAQTAGETNKGQKTERSKGLSGDEDILGTAKERMDEAINLAKVSLHQAYDKTADKIKELGHESNKNTSEISSREDYKGYYERDLKAKERNTTFRPDENTETKDEEHYWSKYM